MPWESRTAEVSFGSHRRRRSGHVFSRRGAGTRVASEFLVLSKGVHSVLERTRTGLREMPSNAVWLMSQLTKPARAMGGAAGSVRDTGRKMTAVVVDAAPVGDSVEIRARRARDAAERAREAEEHAVEAARESKALAERARAVNERGQAQLDAVDRDTARQVSERVAEAQKAADELVRRERADAEADADDQRAAAEDEVEGEIAEAESDAEAAQLRAEELVQEATRALAEARRLADDAAEAARAAAEEASLQAQRLEAEARQQASQAEERIEAAEELRERAAATAKEAARRLEQEAGDGLDAYKKPELVALAGTIGIERRTEMTKDELVDAITKAARRRATGSSEIMRLRRPKGEVERVLDAGSDSLDTVRSGRRSGSLLKIALVVGGAAALTAGSAGHLLASKANGGAFMTRRRAANGSAPVALTASIDRSRRLSEGGLVQASVRARLLGIPLLRLEATLILHAGRSQRLTLCVYQQRRRPGRCRPQHQRRSGRPRPAARARRPGLTPPF